MSKQKLKAVILGMMLTAGGAGCAKTQEVVPPVSTLETSLQPSVMPTQKSWPTAGVSVGQTTPTLMVVEHGTEYATTAAMESQPQTGADGKWLIVALVMVGAGLWLVLANRPDQIRGKNHAKKR